MDGGTPKPASRIAIERAQAGTCTHVNAVFRPHHERASISENKAAAEIRGPSELSGGRVPRVEHRMSELVNKAVRAQRRTCGQNRTVRWAHAPLQFSHDRIRRLAQCASG